MQHHVAIAGSLKRPRSPSQDDDPLRGVKDVAKKSDIMLYWNNAWGKRLSATLMVLPAKTAGSSEELPSLVLEDDALPESPIMSVSIVGNQGEFLVRAEYIRIYDFIEQYFSRAHDKQTPAVVVTGQPGIGQDFTFTLFYIFL